MSLKIKNINVGQDRWYLNVEPSSSYLDFYEFKKWIKENYPDIFCRYKDNYSTTPALEVRGTDQGIKMHIIMLWS